MTQNLPAKITEVERRVVAAKTPEEANTLRRQISVIQKWLGRRREEYVIAFDAASAYLKASVKAGELWSATAPGQGARTDLSKNGQVSATDVGFASRQDASVCLRLAEAAAADQLNTYLEECRKSNDLPTLGGFHEVWKKYVQQHPEIVEAELPPGTFAVIVIDPPWKYEARPEDVSHRARNPYLSMELEDIAALPVPSVLAPNGIVWLWTTNAFMHDAYHLLDGWGLEPKTVLTWAKPKMGLGDWLRGKTEHCILAVRGEPRHKFGSETTLLVAPSREHSRKPDEFYALVEVTCPGRKVDWFSREKRSGWEQYGNQPEKFVAQ